VIVDVVQWLIESLHSDPFDHQSFQDDRSFQDSQQAQLKRNFLWLVTLLQIDLKFKRIQ
jgi:hypothetical protein